GTHAESVQARWPVAVPPSPDAAAVRDILSADLGVLRERDGLSQAVAARLPTPLALVSSSPSPRSSGRRAAAAIAAATSRRKRRAGRSVRCCASPTPKRSRVSSLPRHFPAVSGLEP